MRVGDLRPLSLFDGLTHEQLGELIVAGTEVRIQPGLELFHEGDHADFWWVLVDGAINLWRHVGREDTVVGRMDVPGRWAGGFRAWDEHGVYLASGRGVEEGRVLRVPAAALRDWSSAWFPFATHLIQGLYRTARTIEATARQRESLVTLGTLAAGLAHELNNPAAAASRAVGALEAATQTLLGSLGRLADGSVSAAQLAVLDGLRSAVQPPTSALDPVDLADAEEVLADWLRDHGVARDWTIAPTLAAAGVDVAWCERVGDALPGAALAPGLEWVASSLAVATLLSEVKESTRRVSELVGAVRSYSQMDRAAVQRIDVVDGLESTLVMLAAKLRSGVTVRRAYSADVPVIEAYAGELNQVWTNLIDNAVDAMDGRGTLTIATRGTAEHVVVEIGDTGPGFSPAVAARAFEAFFTTKEVGKGTGLGLDIAQRIVVQRHGGTLEIDGGPGATVLRVTLPVHRSPTSG